MNDFYRADLKAAAFFTDMSADLAGGGDVLHIPNLSEMTAHAKVNAQAVTLNNPTETDVDLTVNTWMETSFAIEDLQAEIVKKSYSIQERYAKNASYTVAGAYEDTILALFAGFSQFVGTSAAAVADSDIRAAINYLDVANAPQEGRAFFFHPQQIWTELEAIDRFSLLVNTAGADPVLKGHVGYLYGIPVVSSTRIGITDGSFNSALAQSDAIVHASTLMRVQSNYIPQYLSTVTTADVIFGAVENRDTSGVWIATQD